MTRFNMFTDDELYAMEEASCNRNLRYLYDEIRSANELKMQNIAKRKTGTPREETNGFVNFADDLLPIIGGTESEG